MNLLVLALLAAPAFADPGPALFRKHCASCHESGARNGTPGKTTLAMMFPERVMRAMNERMSAFARELSVSDRRAVSLFATGRPFGYEDAELPSAAWCKGVTHPHFPSEGAAGVQAQDIPRLKLKWAFGLPGETTADTRPVVFGGRIFFGTAGRWVHSLDAKTGCVHWSHAVYDRVSTSVEIAPFEGETRAAYLGDSSGTVYALDARTGKVLWMRRLEESHRGKITGSLRWARRKLYVPLTTDQGGKLAALEARTGRVLWITPMTPPAASGAALEFAPAFDDERVYVTTGRAASGPALKTSDAIVAMDAATGIMRWIHQQPPESGGDSFVGSPVLISGRRGKRILIGPSRHGLIALDPDSGGHEPLWRYLPEAPDRIDKLGTGPAILGGSLFIGAEIFVKGDENQSTGGLMAFDLRSGKLAWKAFESCKESEVCHQGVSGSISAVPGAVFAGTLGGRVRAYSPDTGKILWDYDTLRTFETVNSVEARGGAIDGTGPVIGESMVYVMAGYFGDRRNLPGNVLLAFSPDGK